MRIWQKLMISLALNNDIKEFIQGNPLTSRAALSFVGGQNEKEAVEKFLYLDTKKIDTSFFSLGEYASEESIVENTIASLEKLICQLEKKNVNLHISIDPTQLGLIQGYDYCEKNIIRIAECIDNKIKKEKVLMLDMEDSSTIEDTLSVYRSLKKGGHSPAITLQAYLYRTREDIEEIYHDKGYIRLVKGAFAEDSSIAYTSKKRIDQEYYSLCEYMLEKKFLENGSFPVFATHDHVAVAKIIDKALKGKIDKDKFGFEMLYGVRPGLQREIVDKGYRLRLYLPYGTDWWPYTIRRGGESFKNLLFIIRSLLLKN